MTGRFDDDGIRRCLEVGGETVCTGKAGDVSLMRPLLLHASSRAVEPTHRRVLHLEFAAGPLPGGLEWQEAVGMEETILFLPAGVGRARLAG